MNETRFEKTLEAIEALPPPRLRTKDGRTGPRTNDPNRTYIRKDCPPRTDDIATVLDARVTQLNLRVGLAMTETETIGGIGALVLQSDPDGARRIDKEAHGAKSLNEIASTMLSINTLGWARHQLLNGPNWAGENAAWLTPAEVAAGMRKIRAMTEGDSEHVKDPWAHAHRDRLQTLTQAFEPAKAGLEEWARRESGDTQNEAEVLERIRAEYPTSEIAIDAKIEPTATIGNGCQIGRKVQIGRGVWIHAQCTVEDEARIEADSSIGLGTKVGRYTTIGSSTRIGQRNRIGESTVIGNGVETGNETRIGEEAYLGDGVATGRRCTIGNHGQIKEATAQEGSVVGEHAKVGPHAEVGTGAVIGDGATVTHARVPGRTIIAAKLSVRTQGEADRYAMRYEGDGLTAQPPARTEKKAATPTAKNEENRTGAREAEGTQPQVD